MDPDVVGLPAGDPVFTIQDVGFNPRPRWATPTRGLSDVYSWIASGVPTSAHSQNQSESS